MTDTKEKDTKATKAKGQDLENPPVIQSYERELVDASALGDEDQIAEITERYNAARADLAERRAKREAKDES